MTRDDYKAAARAISDFRWVLAAALASTGIDHSKESKKRMAELSTLQAKLEQAGMEVAP